MPHPSPHHPALGPLTRNLRDRRIGRREFMALVTGLGISPLLGRQLLGATPDVTAHPPPRQGGTLRVQLDIKPLKSPRTTDWSSIANIMRGTFEHLVEYNNDGSLRGMLLESWTSNSDATRYTLHIRPGVTWHTGEPLTAAHIAWNIHGWCDSSVAGNSMASRMAALIDPQTGQAKDGAITVLDPLTVQLDLIRPDITLVLNMADFPAAIIHPSFDDTDIPANPGTGPYEITSIIPGSSATLTRRDNHTWWGTEVYGGPYLDRIEYLDLGQDPSIWSRALIEGQIDMLSETVGPFVEALDELGMVKSEVATASTAVIRTHQAAAVGNIRPYATAKTRQALALAVDNNIILELGIGDRGTIAENTHVSPLHPEYAPRPLPKADPEAALSALQKEGLAEFEHELVSLDDEWMRATADAVAAQLLDAGIKVRRKIVPGSDYWENWAQYPFSTTSWNHRPLAVQILSVAYRSGADWNETGFSNPRFDALIDEALGLIDVDRRRHVMAKIETLMQEEGVIIQPYWRNLYRHVRPGLLGTDIHITLDHHHYKWGFA